MSTSIIACIDNLPYFIAFYFYDQKCKFLICDWICEKGYSTHIQFYELGRPYLCDQKVQIPESFPI